MIPFFYPRCLSKDHKIFQCPNMQAVCTICEDANRGDLSHGHLRKVHHETDRQKRDHITRFISKICFPDWYPASKKRKLEM